MSNIFVSYFFSGQPSKLFDENNPDWAPSINLGYPQSARGEPVALKKMQRYVRAKGRSTAKVLRSVFSENQPQATPGATNAIEECEFDSYDSGIPSDDSFTRGLRDDCVECVPTTHVEDSVSDDSFTRDNTNDVECALETRASKS